MTDHYDILVIGSGPGGATTALRVGDHIAGRIGTTTP